MNIRLTRKGKVIYDILTTLLIIISVTISILDIENKISSNKNLYIIDNIIWCLFVVDYFTRLIISKNRKMFFKKNIIDLVAIIPFNSLFIAFRFLRLTKLFKFLKISKLFRFVKVMALLGRFSNKMYKFLHTNGFIYILYLNIATILLGAIGIYYAELHKTIKNFGDAIWWSFVTSTTVGYGDISPQTPFGRIISVCVMMVGIGFVGMLTGTIATYHLNKKNEDKKTINHNGILDLTGFSEDDCEKIYNYVEYIKSQSC